MGINDVIQDAQALWSFFTTSMPQLVTAVPLMLIPAGLLLIRQVIKNTKSLLFYSRGRGRR